MMFDEKRWGKVGVALLLCLLCSTLHAQKLTETKVQTYVGFENPRVVDGIVYASAGSKPVVASVTSTINVEVPEGKFPLVEAIRKSDLEPITLIEDGTQYRMPADAPHGVYRVSLRAFDTAKGFTPAVYLDVTISGVGPGPIVPDDTLSVLSKDARRAMADFVQAQANDMDALASEIEAKRVTNMLQASAYTTPRDVSTRTVFKQSMAKILEPKVGVADLPPESVQIFKDVAAGFRSVK